MDTCTCTWYNNADIRNIWNLQSYFAARFIGITMGIMLMSYGIKLIASLFEKMSIVRNDKR